MSLVRTRGRVYPQGMDAGAILDTSLTDAEGRTATVGERVAGRPAVLVFVRHFG